MALPGRYGENNRSHNSCCAFVFTVICATINDMISRLHRKILATVVALLLLLSCAGIGLGMTGHTALSGINIVKIDMMPSHACCTIGKTEGGLPNQIMMAFHEAGIGLGVQYIVLSSILLLLFSRTRFQEKKWVHYTRYLQMKRRMAECIWKEKCRWVQLCNSGLLHPKSW